MKTCDQGYQGQCCCLCKHQLKLLVCDCGRCPTIKGYVCKVFWEMDKKKGGAVYTENKHGCCELFDEIKENL